MPRPRTLPLVSVIIPTYQRQGQLAVAVQSVISQKGLGKAFEVELIIIDDASPAPQTASVSATGLSICVERHNSNQGPAAARNTGVSLASGDFIAFLDSDDAWRPDKLAAQVATAAGLPADELWALATGFRIKRNRTQQWENLVPVDLATPEDFLRGCRHSPGSTSFLPRHVFDNVGLLDAELDRLEDYEWYVRFGKAGGKLYSVPSILVDIDPSNSVTRDKVLRAIDMIDAKLSQWSLTPEQTTLMRAYLNLERGATLLRSESPFLGAYALIRSFLLSPRLRLHLAPISTEANSLESDSKLCLY